jgi:hypothetical protein
LAKISRKNKIVFFFSFEFFMLVVVFIVMIVFVGLISWSWVRGIDYMKENHPDYKGEDFLSTSAGRDLWDEYDEDTIHTEGEI